MNSASRPRRTVPSTVRNMIDFKLPVSSNSRSNALLWWAIERRCSIAADSGSVSKVWGMPRQFYPLMLRRCELDCRTVCRWRDQVLFRYRPAGTTWISVALSGMVEKRGFVLSLQFGAESA